MRPCLIPEATAERIGRLQALAVERRIPLEGTVELTRRCNLNCVHCYLGGPPAAACGRREMSSADALLVFDQLVGAGTLHLTLTGGEPMLRGDFDELYSHAAGSGMCVTVFTNATLVDERKVRLFRALPPRKIEITVHGATAGTFEAITRVPGSFPRFWAGLQRLLEAGIRVSLKTVVMRSNSHELDRIEDLARACGVPFRYDTALFPGLPDAHGAQRPGRELLAALRLSPVEAVALDTASPERSRPWLAALSAEPSPDRPRPLYGCGAGVTNFHVDHEGFLTPCLLISETRHDVVRSGFKEGWFGPIAALRHREAPTGFPCTRCPVGSLCPGCPALFDLEEGAPDRISSYLCATGRERFARLAGATGKE